METSNINAHLKPVLVVHEDEEQDDGRGTLVLAAGIMAAALGGGIWAGVVLLTNTEVGWVAWGVGGLVGLAMSRMTRRRTRQLAYAAAAYAAFGLIVGKAFIFSGSAGIIAKEIEGDGDLMASTVAWQMYQARELSPPTLDAIDAAAAAGNELDDATWAAMQDEAGVRVAQMTSQQKHEAATVAAKGTLENVGLLAGIRSQLSAFDLLWIFLAVATAYGMMTPRKREAEVYA